MDLLLNSDPISPDYHDMVFINGSCTTTQDTRDVVAQRLRILLQTFTNEWFLDTQYGIPYWDFLGKKVPKQRVDRVLQEKIMKERGVLQLVSFNSTLENRVYSLTFSVRTSTGVTEDIVISGVNL